MTAPAWLHNEILDGLSKLICLRLDNAPAEDMARGTAAAWGVALTARLEWDEHRDRHRVRAGFDRLLAAGLTRWPQPQKLIECLPEPSALRLAGSTRPDPHDPYEAAHRKRLAEYEASVGAQVAGANGLRDHRDLADIEAELAQHYAQQRPDASRAHAFDDPEPQS